MSWNMAIGALRDKLPRFNDYLLQGYKEEQFNNLIPHLEYVFQQACSLFSQGNTDNHITYKDYQILNPEQTVNFRITSRYNNGGTVDIQQNNLQLVKFNFDYQYRDRTDSLQYGSVSVYLFLPYLVNGALVIGGTRYFPQLTIHEKMISHIENGILIKVLRSPINFWRQERSTAVTVTGEKYSDMKIQVKAHQKKSKKKNDDRVPLVLYLLARFGLAELIQKNWLGLTSEDLSFERYCPLDKDAATATSTNDVLDDEDNVEEDEDTTDEDEDEDADSVFLSNDVDSLQRINAITQPIQYSAEMAPHDPDEYIYFKCKDGVYLKVKQDVMDSTITKRFILDLLGILATRTQYNLEDLYSPILYRTILGKMLYPTTFNDDLAHNHACDHLASLEDYLDEHTRDNLDDWLNEYFGTKTTQRKDRTRTYRCNNIYELFLLVLSNIDDWINSYIPNNLLTKCLEGIESLIMVNEGIGTTIFTNVYQAQKSKKFDRTVIEKIFKLNSLATTKKLANVSMLQSLNGLYNDNILVSVLAKKSRPNGPKDSKKKNQENLLKSKEYQFHSSVMAVEAILAIPSSSPGISGDINPYLQIDSDGSFLEEKMPWYNTVKSLDRYLIKV